MLSLWLCVLYVLAFYNYCSCKFHHEKLIHIADAVVHNSTLLIIAYFVKYIYIYIYGRMNHFEVVRHKEIFVILMYQAFISSFQEPCKGVILAPYMN
jgi:hypothetical protein